MSKKSHAVLKAYCMWAWLAKTGNAYKDSYSVKELIPKEESFASCSLCEYVNNECEHCPLYTRWGAPDRVVRTCMGYGAFYINWRESNSSSYRKIAAGNIAACLWEVYKELEEV